MSPLTQGKPSQGTATQDTAAQDPATGDLSTPGPSTQDTTTQDSSTSGTATRDFATEGSSTQATSSNDLPSQDAPIQKPPTQSRSSRFQIRHKSTPIVAIQMPLVHASLSQPTSSLPPLLSQIQALAPHRSTTDPPPTNASSSSAAIHDLETQPSSSNDQNPTEIQALAGPSTSTQPQPRASATCPLLPSYSLSPRTQSYLISRRRTAADHEITCNQCWELVHNPCVGVPPDNDVVDEAWCGRCGTCCGACCGDCYRVCCGGLAAWIKEKWFGLGWCREKRRREVVRVARAGKRVDRGRSGGNGRNGDGLLIGDGGSDEGRSEQRREREVNVEGESGENWIGNSYDKSESGEEREQGEGENGNDRGEDGNDVEGEQGDGENGDGNSEGESNVVQREARERDENGEAEDESGMVHQESEYDVRAREEGNKTSWRTWGGSIRGLSR